MTITFLALAVSKLDSESKGALSSGKTIRAKKKWALDVPGLNLGMIMLIQPAGGYMCVWLHSI